MLGGRLADALGARRTLLAGLTLFTVASPVCGLASQGAMLIVGRAAQGIGAALLSPSALSIITTTFHGHGTQPGAGDLGGDRRCRYGTSMGGRAEGPLD